jgi:hypothetical protein
MNETSNGYDWLPQEELKWYNSSTCSPRKATNVSILVVRVLTNSTVQNPCLDTKCLQIVDIFCAFY